DGDKIAPDATFTLRLAFGVVKGYAVDGATLPYATTYAGLFERAERQGHKPPFALPRRWLEGKGKLDMAAPFNFVSTADTIGGIADGRTGAARAGCFSRPRTLRR